MTSVVVPVAFSLGSNLEVCEGGAAGGVEWRDTPAGLPSAPHSRLDFLRLGVAGLRAVPGLVVEKVSPVYETTPFYGPPDSGGPTYSSPQQQNYLNCVVTGTATVAAFPGGPQQLLDHCLAIEQTAGRVRRERWGPRTLDIDLLIWGEVEVSTPTLSLSHPRLAERAFVLVPWAECTPEQHVPGLGTVAQLLARLPESDKAGVWRWEATGEGKEWPC